MLYGAKGAVKGANRRRSAQINPLLHNTKGVFEATNCRKLPTLGNAFMAFWNAKKWTKNHLEIIF